MKIKIFTAFTAFAVSLSAFAQATPSPAPNLAPHESQVRHTSGEHHIARKDIRDFRHHREVGPEAAVQPSMSVGRERVPGPEVEGGHHGFARKDGAHAKRVRFELRNQRHEMRDARVDKRESLQRAREERHEKRVERRERRHQAEHAEKYSAPMAKQSSQPQP